MKKNYSALVGSKFVSGHGTAEFKSDSTYARVTAIRQESTRAMVFMTVLCVAESS